jgi:hypothetical protein
MPQYFPPASQGLSHATGYAKWPGEAQYPHLWRGHVGTIAPCVVGWERDGINCIGGRKADHNQGFTGACHVLSRIGRSYNLFDGRLIRFFTAPGASNPFKVDPPFTLSCVVRVNELLTSNIRVLWASDMRGPGPLAKYAGIMVYLNDTDPLFGQQSICVAQYDNTGVLMVEAVPTAAGPTLVACSSSAIWELQWVHLVIRCSPIVQGYDVTTNPEDHVRFWRLGLEHTNVDGSVTNVGQGLAHATTAQGGIGYNRTDGVETPDDFEVALWQLWNRKLSIAEINHLCRDPLAMMRPIERSYMMPVAAATTFPKSYGYVMG